MTDDDAWMCIYLNITLTHHNYASSSTPSATEQNSFISRVGQPSDVSKFNGRSSDAMQEILKMLNFVPRRASEAFPKGSKGSKSLHLLLMMLKRLLKAFKRVSEASKGAQRLSMELRKGFGGFQRASRALGSLPRAFQRALKAFICFWNC